MLVLFLYTAMFIVVREVIISHVCNKSYVWCTLYVFAVPVAIRTDQSNCKNEYFTGTLIIKLLLHIVVYWLLIYCNIFCVNIVPVEA